MGGRFVLTTFSKKADDLALEINMKLTDVEERADLVDVKLFKDKHGNFCALLILEEKEK